jgi:hypothetical protein
MADTFKIQEAITFVQQTPPETYRLMDVTINNIPTAYNHGKILIEAEVADQLIATQVNIFVMNCAVGVSVKIGGTTETELLNITHFSYKGSKVDIYMSNPETEDTTVTFATCTI